MRTLDERLYAWLAEPDEHRFEQAFSAYFSLAFPAVVRHLARLARWDSTDLEDLAQDALLRFFQRVGRDRREASDSVAASLAGLQPLGLGALHQRHVVRWAEAASSFRASVMSFRPFPCAHSESRDWKSGVRSLAERIPTLQREGCHILISVRFELLGQAGPTPGSDLGRDDLHGEAVQSAAERFSEELAAGTPQAIAAETQCPGVVRFSGRVHTVIVALPRLRVPTNSYLFEIAMSIYFDECRRRGRRKRGGPGETDAEQTMTSAAQDLHPLDLMALSDDDAAEPDHDDETAAAAHCGPSFNNPTTADPTQAYEHQEFFEKFQAYLREPLERALQGWQSADTAARATAAQRKVDALSAKLARTLAVLTMLGEGYTQEQIAERLEVSRNQVKYVIELVQEAYERFAEAEPRFGATCGPPMESSHAG
jgi:DNA-directed RNA polymerase specialized sigma24 family protein